MLVACCNAVDASFGDQRLSGCIVLAHVDAIPTAVMAILCRPDNGEASVGQPSGCALKFVERRGAAIRVNLEGASNCCIIR